MVLIGIAQCIRHGRTCPGHRDHTARCPPKRDTQDSPAHDGFNWDRSALRSLRSADDAAGRMAPTSSMLVMPICCASRSPRENIIRAPGDNAVRSPAPWRPRLLDALWFGRSVRAQLLIVFIAINAIAALVAGGVTIFKAGAATRIEIAASMRLAELMVERSRATDPAGHSGRAIAQDAAGAVALGAPCAHRRARRRRRGDLRPLGPPRDEDRAAAPRWFAALIGPPIETHDVPVAMDGKHHRHRGDRQRTARRDRRGLGEHRGARRHCRRDEPRHDRNSLLRARPRARSPHRPGQRPRGPRAPRLQDAAGAAEGAGIRGDHRPFQRARRRARCRARRESRAQPPARHRPGRRTPATPRSSCTTRSAPACSASRPIPPPSPRPPMRSRTARRRPFATAPPTSPPSSNTCKASTGASSTGCGRWRSATSRCRKSCPSWCASAPAAIPISVSPREVDRLARSYGDTVDLTLYRCVQESLTNAIRHAEATAVMVQCAGTPRGRGRAGRRRRAAGTDGARRRPRHRRRNDKPGFGLRGMQERVQALGGEFAIETGRGRDLHPHRHSGAGARFGRWRRLC